MRFIPFLCCVLACVLAASLAIDDRPWLFLTVLPPLAALAGLGCWDVLQRRHTLLRNYPVIGHMRWLSEAVRGQIHQYFVESDTDGRPFNRNERSVVYARAKDMLDNQPFGSELDVYADGFEWLNHSIAAGAQRDEPQRVSIGGDQCRRPYAASVFNISAMSFGALGAAAVRALNRGARLGGFAQDTGEGAISPYHREEGGDLIWEIGTGYFGCRQRDGTFDAGLFAEQASAEQVRMVEVKLSQGAKPGHGGILPKAKVTPEIAAARGVPIGEDCISPPSHSAFASPVEMLEFIARLRDLSGGKPTGFKLCVSHRWEFMAICKAMLKTGISPDFVVVDGAEGGTGAAPVELADHVGMPLRDGLVFVRNCLVGCGLRERLRIGASGKVTTACHIAVNMALGADWCNAARGFMFALGCVQSQRCHTDQCPTGVTTQNPLRQRALVVADKARRVRNYHRHMVRTLSQVVAACGLDDCSELAPHHVCQRVSPTEVRTLDRAYPLVGDGALLQGEGGEEYRRFWDMARAESFAPAV